MIAKLRYSMKIYLLFMACKRSSVRARYSPHKTAVHRKTNGRFFYRPRRLKRIGAADPKVAQPRNYCGSPYAYTNGYFTTSAFINLSRITTAMTVPIAAYSLLTYPKPMPHLSMGDMVPDVTWPISSPSRFASL